MILEKELKLELKRQNENVELIASENYVSNDILKAAGSILTNKYAEGYPYKRYYGGCENVDIIEQKTIDLAKKLFNSEHANVQPHSGSQANTAAFYALLNPGDKILGMSLSAGGHLTHGYKVNFSGTLYKAKSYGVSPKTHLIDYEEVKRIAKEWKPKLIIAGASSYSRIIDWKKFRKIADEVNAFLVVDMAHISGLVAVGLHPSPIPYADIVTSTTHKTLRGPRSGLILCKKKFAKQVDSAVFPGNQGGPLEHIIYAKAICFTEALKPEFKIYQEQVIKNSKAMVNEFKKHNIKITADGTDNHLFSVNVKKGYGITGIEAEENLDKICITVNKNTIPNDSEKPYIASGIRIGTPAITTRGFKEKECQLIINIIHNFLSNKDKWHDKNFIDPLKTQVKAITCSSPIYKTPFGGEKNV